MEVEGAPQRVKVGKLGEQRADGSKQTLKFESSVAIIEEEGNASLAVWKLCSSQSSRSHWL